MARRSLKPQLNQIRAWVRQGRTDAWIAHQLEVTVQQIESFRRDNELASEEGDGGGGEGFVEEVDLRAEDDALIAAELEAAEEADEAADEEPDEEVDEDAPEGDEDGERPAAKRGGSRRRGRRGGSRRRKGGPLEGTF